MADINVERRPRSKMPLLLALLLVAALAVAAWMYFQNRDREALDTAPAAESSAPYTAPAPAPVDTTPVDTTPIQQPPPPTGTGQ